MNRSHVELITSLYFLYNLLKNIFFFSGASLKRYEELTLRDYFECLKVFSLFVFFKAPGTVCSTISLGLSRDCYSSSSSIRGKPNVSSIVGVCMCQRNTSITSFFTESVRILENLCLTCRANFSVPGICSFPIVRWCTSAAGFNCRLDL